MIGSIAFISSRGSGGSGVRLVILSASAAVVLMGRYWRFFVQWVQGIRGGDWPMVSAAVDIVSVAPQVMDGRGRQQVIGYVATLTYFYRNPELQTGDYTRRFDDEGSARDWAASFKGSNVMVHVDPRDPSRSVLRKEQLA
jgi:hypothetical protein